MAVIRDRNSRRPWRKSSPTSKLKSSSAPITQKDLWYCRAVGSSSAPLLGSTDADDLPRIGRTSIERRWLSCASPQSASCSENFVIPLDVPGQTLREPPIGLYRARPANRSGPARLHRKPWLGTVERLDLALFVDRENNRMGGRIDVEADDIRSAAEFLSPLTSRTGPAQRWRQGRPLK